MAVGSNQPLTEISTMNLPGGGGGERRLARKADLTASQPYGRPQPVTGIALPFFKAT
jgi:hypothetical protein